MLFMCDHIHTNRCEKHDYVKYMTFKKKIRLSGKEKLLHEEKCEMEIKQKNKMAKNEKLKRSGTVIEKIGICSDLYNYNIVVIRC